MAGLEKDADQPVIPDIDMTVPTTARIYDALLYGKDNFAADRAVAEMILEGLPEIRKVALDNRAWLSRVVHHMTDELGIDQYIDVGSGLPSAENTHQVAQRVNPDVRVVYLDNDPIVLAHGRALLADNKNTTVFTADATRPEEILGNEQLRELIDFDRPVGVLFIALLHCIPDKADPARCISAMMDAVPAGSYLAYSHLVSDNPSAAAELTNTMLENTHGNWGRVRSPQEAADLVGDLEPLAPGFIDVRTWGVEQAQPPQDIWEIGGLFKKV
ncbi:SAM-dependent methyltransferase [Nocardiopsis ansamitocini]|uniref:S-adenosyl methyltransferase n=1 Tax=Nocardiopsis ansamitocini TaxID=1670832 RepID=A0A9W6P6Z3_9ACTN|nr:SAM-dependent methyltransferase [Nocardiopsis ansamitocini]GLU48172.1 hypothetical protein Nans01_25230 [Nocardiopsis ansamitocini]